MQVDRTGIILYTLEYQKCVQFYADVLEFKVMFKSENLTCFEFGLSYLMVELDEENSEHLKGTERTRTCLRINVPNVKVLADKLIANNIKVDYQEHSWGTVAKFIDPDGNLCAFKDSTKFEQQVSEYKNGS